MFQDIPVILNNQEDVFVTTRKDTWLSLLILSFYKSNVCFSKNIVLTILLA